MCSGKQVRVFIPWPSAYCDISNGMNRLKFTPRCHLCWWGFLNRSNKNNTSIPMCPYLISGQKVIKLLIFLHKTYEVWLLGHYVTRLLNFKEHWETDSTMPSLSSTSNIKIAQTIYAVTTKFMHKKLIAPFSDKQQDIIIGWSHTDGILLGGLNFRTLLATQIMKCQNHKQHKIRYRCYKETLEG